MAAPHALSWATQMCKEAPEGRGHLGWIEHQHPVQEVQRVSVQAAKGGLPGSRQREGVQGLGPLSTSL